MAAARPFLESILHIYAATKQLGDRAMAQLTFEEMMAVPAGDLNSIAIIIGHLRGNMLSRWTDFLTSDGDKPWRQRDAEFETPAAATREELLALWEEGWRCCLGAIGALTEVDLARTITIRGQAHSVTEALHRQLHHYSYHVGQIVLLARLAKGDAFETLSIARGQSSAYRPSGKAGEPPVR